MRRGKKSVVHVAQRVAENSKGGTTILEPGQLADTPTRGLPTRGLDISRTGQLAD